MAVLCIFLGIVCIFDYTRGRIPNLILVVLTIVGMMRGLLNAGAGGLIRFLVASTVVLFLLYPLFQIGGLGGGDVKLLSVCAGYFPVSQIFLFLFLSMLLSAVFSLIPVLKEKHIKERATYFCAYCLAVIRSKKWQLYLPTKDGRRLRGVCMSGPILCSALICWGGII